MKELRCGFAIPLGDKPNPLGLSQALASSICQLQVVVIIFLIPDEEESLCSELVEQILRQNLGQRFGRVLLTRVSLLFSGRSRVECTLLARSGGGGGGQETAVTLPCSQTSSRAGAHFTASPFLEKDGELDEFLGQNTQAGLALLSSQRLLQALPCA